jgi:hypothetical protein
VYPNGRIKWCYYSNFSGCGHHAKSAGFGQVRLRSIISEHTTANLNAISGMSAAQLEAALQVNLAVHQAKKQVESGGHVFFTYLAVSGPIRTELRSLKRDATALGATKATPLFMAMLPTTSTPPMTPKSLLQRSRNLAWPHSFKIAQTGRHHPRGTPSDSRKGTSSCGAQ